MLSLYALFLVATVNNMIAMHSPAHAQVMTATSELPQSDFARFWFVGKSLDAKQDPAWPLRASFQVNILSRSAGNLIWLYPPTMNLAAMLFAILPLGYSFWVWRAFSWAVAAILLRCAGLSWVVIIAGVLSPAGLHDTLGGQNGTLIGAMLVSALLLMDRNPRIAGMIAGMLCIKPQMAIIVPFAVLGGRLIALWSCGLTVVALVVLSVFVEGPARWLWFLRVAEPASRHILETPISSVFPAGGYTVFIMARTLHASLREAWLAQAICALFAGIIVWKLWRFAHQNPVPRMAATLSLAALMAPYGFIYDLTGFAIGMAAMTEMAPMRLKACFAVLWLASGYCLTLANVTGLVIFPLAACVGAALSLSLIEQAYPIHAHAPLPKKDAPIVRTGAR